MCVSPTGRGQAGSEEGSQGRGQRDPHEGAGEATKRGTGQENAANVTTLARFRCGGVVYTIKRIS